MTKYICGVGIAVLALTGCVAVRPIPIPPTKLRAWAEVSPNADCPYLNVFVDSTHEYPEKDRFFPEWRDAEPYRVDFLNSAARSLPAASWHVVGDSKDAAFTLKSSGSRMRGSVTEIGVTLIFAPTPGTIQHAYIASLNNPRFPLRDSGLFGALIPRFPLRDSGLFGALMTFTVVGSYSEVELQNHINRFLEFTQAQAFEAVAALCETREQLTDEGTSFEELRRELIEEIHRVRRQRLREKQAKELKLEVETQ